MLAFLFVVVGLSLGSLILPDRDFSPNENRYLASAPTVSLNKIFDGSFQDGLEDYLKDQVLARDSWITIKTFFQKSTGNTDIGGAYVGKDGYDFEKITPDDVDDKLVKKNAKAVNDYFTFCTELLPSEKVNFLLVPTSGLVYKEYLPKNAILFDQDKYMDEIAAKIENGNVIDARKSLVGSSVDYLYYKTDHHWTTDGAFEVANQLRKATGKSEVDKGSVVFETVADNFKGSLYSKILDADSSCDTINVVNRADAANYTVFADGKDIGSFYQEEKLSEKDKYTYFFGGNYGEVIITNKNGQGKGNLLVIKDSFANEFVPLIAEDYEHVYMIDLRYYNADMAEYLSENDISEVLVLYNISNFISDRNIFKLSKNIGR